MTKEEDFKLLKIQKVKKLLQRIEGVYQVNIDSDQQKVTVSGSVDSATLIKKLVRGGKHAELWSQKANQNQKQKNNCIKDDKNNKGQKQGLMKGLEAFKNHPKFPAFSSEEDDDYFDDDDEDDEEDELRFLREKANQLSMLRQQAIDANKKAVGAISAVPSNVKLNNNVGNGNGGKKGGHPNQNNMGMKASPGEIDQKTMAALKMSNPHLGGGNINAGGEAKRANDLNTMMSLAGFHGNGPNVGGGTAGGLVGGNPNGLGGGGFQVHQANNGYQATTPSGLPSGGYATGGGGQYPSSMMMNMNGYNHQSPMMNMNMQARHAMQQQPQMMYHRSPFVPPSTGYYYNYNPCPPTPPYSYPEPHYSNTGDSAAAHMFSDENTSGCSIM
ncbi:hypothetical protein FEM48_Zijuj10G0127900 [Ziziphus jujuba var. spinosa]|uniref:HMA domain-containing protein n=1 Tax=Ziziphus jujuba var. spinosa TaxID=714518 RepID=A0A978UNG9_ZIZJJ|nr:hypothetical protein FEM48_Zijuj10G0127900 [Ziziphus jujuba var. spinosa]